MIKWLTQHGAKAVALLSRSGPASANAKTLTEEFNGSDINISVLKCDVGDIDQIRKAVKFCSQSMPPIRGIIHGAMVLHV